jgi:hypothetical protein
MKAPKLLLLAVLATSSSYIGNAAFAAERWQEDTFAPPNGGRLVFAIRDDGNPACASYDGSSCLWGKTMAEIDFAKVRPLVCGAGHRKLYGVTGFEDPNHWCNLALRARTTQRPPATPPPPAGGYRLTDWSAWNRAAGVEYRYRVGWDPVAGSASKTVDVVYEIRNPGVQRWLGAARSLDCAQGTLWGSTDVALAAGRTGEFRVRAPNCGNTRNPDICPNLVRAGRFD